MGSRVSAEARDLFWITQAFDLLATQTKSFFYMLQNTVRLNIRTPGSLVPYRAPIRALLLKVKRQTNQIQQNLQAGWDDCYPEYYNVNPNHHCRFEKRASVNVQ